MAENELINNARLKRRGAKAAMIRLGKALNILIESKRPIEEIKELDTKLNQLFEDLEETHKEFTQMIEDSDEFSKEEQWLEECQQMFLNLTHLSTDYCEGMDESECSKITYEVINVQENDEKKPNKKRFCVTYCDVTKLITVETLSYEEVKTKIKVKFQLSEPFSIAVKLPDFHKYIDVDVTDDVEIFNEARHILVRKQSSSSSIDDTATNFPGCSSAQSAVFPVPVVSNGSIPEQIMKQMVHVDLVSGDNVDYASTSASVYVPIVHKKPLDGNHKIRELLQEKSADGIIEELDTGLLSFKSRKEMVNIVVSYLIEIEGPKPTTKAKLALAKSIIKDFPLMDNEDGNGYTAWFQPCIGKIDSCGFLENRIRNVRRRRLGTVYIAKLTNSGVRANKRQANVASCGRTSNIDGETEFNEVDMSAVSSFKHLNTASTSDGVPTFHKRPRLEAEYKIRELLQEKKADRIIEELDSGLLSFKSRKEMVNIVVSRLIEVEGRNPTSKTKLALAKSITHDFPLMDNEAGDGYAAWYLPCVDRQDASGFLEHKIRNVQRRQLRKTEPTQSGSEANLISTENLTTEVVDSDMTAVIMWLKYHSFPEDEVQEMMAKTCKARAAIIQTKQMTINELLIEFPRLVDTEGMIEQDFGILFPNTKDALYMKWPKYAHLILKYAEKQVDWRHLLYFRGNLNTDVHISNIVFYILPLLFQPGMTILTDGVTRKMIRATHADASTSFLHVERVSANVPILLETHKHVLPFVLAIGEYEQPEQVFVVIQRQVITCKSLVHAVDICFKLFHVLGVEFPWECQNTWDFFQKYIYGLGSGKGRKSTVSSVSLLGNFVTQKQNL